MDNTKLKRGIYFLADDRILELAIAYLNSLRKFNPEVSLCLIPYVDNIKALRSLQEEYGFSILQNTRVFDFCSDISVRFQGEVFGEYRKLAMWEGEFDEFIYIDVDTIVQDNLDFVFSLLPEYDFITSHSNLPETFQWVWKETVYQSGMLNEEQIRYAANTGFIASRKGVLNIEMIAGKLESAAILAPYMNFYCREQALLNYFIVTSGRKFTSLETLARSKLYSGIKTEHWAGDTNGVIKNGKIYFKNKPDPVLLLHWAGKWQPVAWDRIIFFILKMLRIKKKEDQPVLSYFMPYRRFWKFYRNLNHKGTRRRTKD